MRELEQRCRVCGCTWNNACMTEFGPCYWVEDDLCSACAEKVKQENGYSLDWKEVKKPLTFQAVLEGAKKNQFCKISIEHELIGEGEIWKHRLDILLLTLSKIYSAREIAEILTEGILYID